MRRPGEIVTEFNRLKTNGDVEGFTKLANSLSENELKELRTLAYSIISYVDAQLK